MIEQSTAQLYAQKQQQWNAFMKHGEILPEVRPFIAASWLRCKKYGVKQEYDTEILSETALHELLLQNKELLDIAHPILAKLMELVAGSQYVITLHDRNGYIIDYVFDGNYNPQSTYFRLGAKWVEQLVGTNGAHVSILCNEPIQILGAEHYCQSQHTATCSAAPVHDNNGRIIGCINMTGHNRNSNPHTLGLVASGAYAIENQLALVRSYQLITDTFDLISEGIVVLDAQFLVQRVSRFAAHILKMRQDRLIGIDFRGFFQSEDFEKRVQSEKQPFSYTEYDLRIGGEEISCNISVTPMLTSGRLIGVILLLRESKSIHRIVNKVTGNKARYHFPDIITQDLSMLAEMEAMKGTANTGCCVLIEGESGTGKELFAHSIHSYSNRGNGPFVAVNCASLPQSLVESELFGYEKGAFTGASHEGSPGKFELANGGSIFLDEIGELPLEMQAKLLRVLDNHRVMRVGGKTEKELDVRVIAATNRRLEQEVRDRNFREDLYFRINVLKYNIPPLRERRGDIAVLAQFFLDKLNAGAELSYKELSPDFLQSLDQYDWPGNVRELQNVIARAYYSGRESLITPENLPSHMVPVVHPQQPEPLLCSPPATLGAFERGQIMEQIRACKGDVVKAGKQLGMSKPTIYRRIKKYGIDLAAIKADG